MWLALIGGKQLIANRATANSQWSDGDDDDHDEEEEDDDDDYEEKDTDDDDDDEDEDYEAIHDDEIDWKQIWQIGFEKYQSDMMMSIIILLPDYNDDDDVDGSDGGYFRQIDFDKYQLERSSVAKRWESGWNETQLFKPVLQYYSWL